jgi:membrane protein implicated in regulation of membrane protease activity
VAQMVNPEPVEVKVGKPRWLQITLGIMLVLFLFALSLLLMAIAVRDDVLTGSVPESSDLMTLLFGASTISLGVFALLAGGFALFGWGYLKENVKKEVEESLRERIHAVEKELRGRSNMILGYVIGENSVAADGRSPSDKERLREALLYCEGAYTLLKDSGLAVEFTALNNYLYYSCILGEADTYRQDYLLQAAERLREAAVDHSSQNLLLTHARTVLKFSDDPKLLKQARAFVAHIAKSATLNEITLNEKQSREVKYLTSLLEKTDPGVAVTPDRA